MLPSAPPILLPYLLEGQPEELALQGDVQPQHGLQRLVRRRRRDERRDVALILLLRPPVVRAEAPQRQLLLEVRLRGTRERERERARRQWGVCDKSAKGANAYRLQGENAT